VDMPVQYISLISPATRQPFCCHHDASPSERRDQSKANSNDSKASGRKRFETICHLKPVFLVQDRNRNSYSSHLPWASFVWMGARFCMH
jgi:hypothetical protein